MGKSPGDGSDLDVDLLDDSTGSLQFCVDAAEFGGRLLGLLPEEQPRHGTTQTPQVAFPARTAFHSGPKFSENGNADADTTPQLALRNRAIAHAIAIFLIVLCDSGIQ